MALPSSSGQTLTGWTDWLADYSLGELWEKNLLGGRPRPERG